MYKSTPEQGRKGLCQSSASTLALALALRPSKRASEQCVGATEEHQRTCVRGKIPIKDSCGMKNTQKGDLKRVIFVYTKRRNDKGSLLPALRCSHILVTHLRQRACVIARRVVAWRCPTHVRGIARNPAHLSCQHLSFASTFLASFDHFPACTSLPPPPRTTPRDHTLSKSISIISDKCPKDAGRGMDCANVACVDLLRHCSRCRALHRAQFD